MRRPGVLMLLLGMALLDAGAELAYQERFIITEQPVFPARLAANGVTMGSARFLVLVNQQGQLEDFLLLEASHLDVGTAIARVLPEWVFHPPMMDGRPVNAVSRIEINLRSSGSVTLLAVSDDVQNLFGDRKLVGEGPNHYQVAALGDLDHLPVVLHAVPPPPPPPAAIFGETVTVVFGFFIDRDGRVRIPILQDAGEGRLDLAVLESVQQALLQWRFSPPMVRGRAVVVEARQPFRFNAVTAKPES